MGIPGDNGVFSPYFCGQPNTSLYNSPVPPVAPSISTIPGSTSVTEPPTFWGGNDSGCSRRYDKAPPVARNIPPGYGAAPTAMPTQNWGDIGAAFSRRSDGRLISAPQNCSQTYELDAMERAWLETKLVNGSVRKRTPLTTAFSIISIIGVIDPQSGDERYVLVTYCTDTMHTVAIPADDYRNGRLIQHFKEVRRLPGCTKRQANDLLEFLIGSAPSLTMLLFPRQGFIRQNDGTVVFAVRPKAADIPQQLISESLRIRPAVLESVRPAVAGGIWKALAELPLQIKLLILLRIGSLMLFWLDLVQVRPYTVLIVSASSGLNEEQLTALLSTNDLTLHRVPSLAYTQKKLLDELSLVWDGIAVFADNYLADETAKIEAPLRMLLKAAGGDTDCGRNMIVLLSKYAPTVVNQIAADNVLSVSMENVALELDSDTIRKLMQQVDSLVINAMLAATESMKTELLEKCKLLPRYWSRFFDQPLADLAPFLTSAELFLETFCGAVLIETKEMQAVLGSIYEQSLSAASAEQTIIREFASVLSERIRKGTIIAEPKRQQMRINPNAKMLLVEGSRFFISGEVLDEIVRDMKTAHLRSSLTNALRQCSMLNTTDGNTRPIQTYDLQGMPVRLYWYDIAAETLDDDVLHQLMNLDSEPFWLKASELPAGNFVSILRDGRGLVAGQLVQFSDAENGSCYITGQSGFGKSFLMCQLMAKYCAIGHRVVVFDSSASFTPEAMCRNLSEDYVRNHVVFHDIDRQGIPVGLFRIDRNASLPMRKKQLLSILTAGVGELSAPQTNTLRNVLSDMFGIVGNDEQIHTGDILAMMNEQGATYESMRNRFAPLFEDMDACGMAAASWSDFLPDDGKIVVLRTTSGVTEKGNQLIDMLLASLYSYQRENPNKPLDIFIDEVQNQNFSAVSPIRTIMKEGRKFHISIFAATQDYYPRSSELGSVMGKAGKLVFLRPTQNSEGTVASELRFGKADLARFDLMQRGDIIVKAGLYHKEQRRNIPATLSGKVDPFLTETD